MLRVASLLAVVAVSACSFPSRARPADQVRTASEALRRGDTAAAEAIAVKGLELTRANPQSENAWAFRLLSADVALAKRSFPEAATIAEAPMPDGGSFRVLRARQKYLRARLALARRQPAQALTIATEALNEAPEGDELALDVGGFVGQLRLQAGRWDEGEAQLQQVAANAAAAKNQYFEAMAINAFGMGKFLRNRCDEALSSFERVLSLRSLADMPIYSRALYNAGMCYTRLGQFDRAAEAQVRAVAATEKRPASSDYEQALGQLGNTYILQGKTREGLTYMQRAFKAASDAKIPADATLWAKNLAAAYVDLQQWDEAERYNKEAERLWATTRSGREVYNTLTSAAIAAGRGRYDEATRLYENALASPDPPPSVLWDAHFGLANVAIAERQPARASREFEATLEIVERTRSGLLKTEYKLSYLTQLIAFYRAYVDHLIAQGQTERALEIADSSRGRVLAERQGAAAPARATVTAMRARARQSGTIFLSYWLTPARSYLWIVEAAAVRMVPLPPRDELAALVRDHRQAIENALADPLAAKASAGDRLYQTLIAPVATALRPGARVVIVPDGALHGINFETLPVDGARRHYWIEDAEVQVAPSLASLTVGASSPAPPAARARAALVVGDPLPRPPEFPTLKFASTEMASIARNFADTATVISRDRATPAAYRDVHPERFRFVHFAAHATANVDSPLDSAVILSGPDTAYKLYARDVAAQTLAADLVTVSACRSAGERAYSGEGLIGFAWAFLRAGARRVVAGLWDVDDRSTAELMEHMYARIAAGAPPSRALREAKLALIERNGRGAAPYAWGAFELFTVAP